MVSKDCQDLLDHGERRVHQDLLEHPGHQEPQVVEVRLVLTVLLDHLDCWDHLAPEVHKEKKESGDLLVNWVTLDLLDLLESQPDMMLLPFLLFLGKDPLRAQIL